MSTSLTYIIGWPFVAALVLCLVPRNYRFVMRLVAIVATLISMLLAIKLFLLFGHTKANADGYKFVHDIYWWGVHAAGIDFNYSVGVDGVNGDTFGGLPRAIERPCQGLERFASTAS